MTPVPSSTIPRDERSSTKTRLVRRRNRIPVSCAPCRHRKLKCNRSYPCENCNRRGDDLSCNYALTGTSKKHQGIATTQLPTGSPDDMQTRIDKLESLVLSLMANQEHSVSSGTAASAMDSVSTDKWTESPISRINNKSPKGDHQRDDRDVAKATQSIGLMNIHNGNTVFVSDAHWYTILTEINEMRSCFAEHKKQYEEKLLQYSASHPDEEESPGGAFLFRTSRPADQSEIMSMFPRKPLADILVARYFTIYDPALHIIHGPTFQKQYDQYWMYPDQVSIAWISLVLAMMCLALQSYSRAGDEPPELHGQSVHMAIEYRKLTAQSLLLADITQPVSHTIEALILHVYAEYWRSNDCDVAVIISTGIIVRLATRMGFHRDPKPYPIISPFQGEMRRRIWACVRNMDILFSNQAGLPSLVRPHDTNTEPPLNIFDYEICEEIQTLPASRPISEATPTSYMITNFKLVSLFGAVIEAVQQVDGPNYKEIMALDLRLREYRDSIPNHLVYRPLDSSFYESTSHIMARYSLELLYLKSQCILHRKFVCPTRYNRRYEYSLRTCIDASIAILEHQAVLHREFVTGPNLKSIRWFMTSLKSNDFLLAAMLVCLYLYHTSWDSQNDCCTSCTRDDGADVEGMANSLSEKQPDSSTGQFLRGDLVVGNSSVNVTVEGPDMFAWDNNRTTAMMEMLERALNIWENLKNESLDAFKAHTTLCIVLCTLKRRLAYVWRQKKTDGGGVGADRMDVPIPVDDNTVESNYNVDSFGPLWTQSQQEPRVAINAESAENGNSQLLASPEDPRFESMVPQSSAEFHNGFFKNVGDAAGGTLWMPSEVANDRESALLSMLFGSGSGSLADNDGTSNLPDLGIVDWDKWDTYIQGNSLNPSGMQAWGGDALPSSTLRDPSPTNISSPPNIRVGLSNNPLSISTLNVDVNNDPSCGFDDLASVKDPLRYRRTDTTGSTTCPMPNNSYFSSKDAVSTSAQKTNTRWVRDSYRD